MADIENFKFIIDKYNLTLNDEGKLVYQGFPDKRELAVIRYKKDVLLELMKEMGRL